MKQLDIIEVKRLFDEGRVNIHIDRLYNLFYKVADNLFIDYDKFMGSIDENTSLEVIGGEITLSPSSRENYVIINNVKLEDDNSESDIEDDDDNDDDYYDDENSNTYGISKDDKFIDDVIQGKYDDELSSEININF